MTLSQSPVKMKTESSECQWSSFIVNGALQVYVCMYVCE